MSADDTARAGEQVATVVTVDMLRKAMDDVRNQERFVHGTRENPHVVHPSGGVCIECGGYFVPGEGGGT
jgi:hypothetical protein